MSDIDDARLLPHLRQRTRAEERIRLERRQAHIFRTEYDRATDQGIDTTAPQRPGTQGGDPRDLRGIPVIARGVGGTSPHTQPEAETISRSERRRAA